MKSADSKAWAAQSVAQVSWSEARVSVRNSAAKSPKEKVRILTACVTCNCRQLLKTFVLLHVSQSENFDNHEENSRKAPYI